MYPENRSGPRTDPGGSPYVKGLITKCDPSFEHDAVINSVKCSNDIRGKVWRRLMSPICTR